MLRITLLLVLVGTLATPGAIGQEAASRFFCPCPDCDHPGFTKSLDQCGCQTAGILKNQLRRFEADGLGREEIEERILDRYHADLAICSDQDCPQPAGPKRYVIAGFRNLSQAERDEIRCLGYRGRVCRASLVSLEIGMSGLTKPPAEGIGIALRLAGPAIAVIGLAIVIGVAASWRSRTNRSGGNPPEDGSLQKADVERVAQALDAYDSEH